MVRSRSARSQTEDRPDCLLSPEELAAAAAPLPEEDGVPLESFWHRAQITFLIAILAYHWRDRRDFVLGGNQFVYYSLDQADEVEEEIDAGKVGKAYRGPDFFYVSGVPRDKPRKYWAVWQEGGRYPDLIIELLSPKTAKNDRTVKKDLYESVFRTPEYYLFDPRDWSLVGYRLNGNHRYAPITPDKRGRLWSETLGLWLGKWKGSYMEVAYESTWLRFFDPRGHMLPLREEAERERADAAEAEVQRLKAKLAEHGKKKNGR